MPGGGEGADPRLARLAWLAWLARPPVVLCSLPENNHVAAEISSHFRHANKALS